MLRELELLSPAGNKDIGIAAINCGADAVYMAGPAFGAREAAANPVSDIAATAAYAHQFGAKVYVTVNTILKDSELEPAAGLIREVYEAGADALIVQDLGVLRLDLPPIPLFASTQCNIRTPEQARWLESLGFSRLILARELSLEQIREIRDAVSCDLESFVHGALCVSYSGQCYMSCYLTGRSANRGACIQACRNRYDVEDAFGNTLLKNRAVLSLKDLNLSDRIPDLVEAGITSFKIEGRLKNASYVKNTVRLYRDAIDAFLGSDGGRDCRKASFGKLYGGFKPSPEATFTRGFTHYFIDGTRDRWCSMDTAKGVGEYIGDVRRILRSDNSVLRFELAGKVPVSNGDGLCFTSRDGQICGMRADVAEGNIISVKPVRGLAPGTAVYRNLNVSFERELSGNMPRRLIEVRVQFGQAEVTAAAENGRRAAVKLEEGLPEAQNRDLAERNIRSQIGKITEPYVFTVTDVHPGVLPFLPASALNGIRRELARLLAEDDIAAGNRKEREGGGVVHGPGPQQRVRLNCANRLSREIYSSVGVEACDAFELSRDVTGEYRELMRTKYCLRNELGLCPRQKRGEKASPLYLVNNGRRFRVSFDCSRCENVITPAGR